MSNAVFANGMNVACKAGDAKVICAFPDVCLSPPSPPAGPIPIPYPVTSMSSDTTDGSSTVKVGGKEAMLKDKSKYSKCTGDEPATKSLGMGVTNASLGGKTQFAMWSMDVLFEGENVVRAFDITTSNHMSPGNAAVPMVNTEGMVIPLPSECAGIDQRLHLRSHKQGCPSGSNAHHVIPDRCMRNLPGGYPAGYSYGTAPTICAPAPGGGRTGGHGVCHDIFDRWERKMKAQGRPHMKYGQAKKVAAASCAGAVGRGLTAAEVKCVHAQLDAYYKEPLKGPDENAPLAYSKSNSGLSRGDLDVIRAGLGRA